MDRIDRLLLLLLSGPFFIIGFITRFIWQGIEDGWQMGKALEKYYSDIEE